MLGYLGLQHNKDHWSISQYQGEIVNINTKHVMVVVARWQVILPPLTLDNNSFVV